MSTYTVGSDDSVYIEAMITMYQENAQGLADDSLLYINTMDFTNTQQEISTLLMMQFYIKKKQELMDTLTHL